ncbi:ribonuclease III [Porticoccus sp.]|uniref:ribonuclease III n=1 Tax=Porticoccus sp. TaxID=2024853 RepID=UPI003F6A4490
MKNLKSRLLDRLGYQFTDSSLFDLALTHRSHSSANNERLEFLGDAALNFIIGHAVYDRLPQVKEGDLSRYRANLVKGATLTEIARELELGQYLYLGAGELKSGGHRRASILADTVEAIIGAVYLDGGMTACEKVVMQLFSERLANLSENTLRDPKTQLQEFMQARGRPLPNYEVVSVTGEAHSQFFTVECIVDGLTSPALGEGSSRRTAEKNAASKALAGLTK